MRWWWWWWIFSPTAGAGPLSKWGITGFLRVNGGWNEEMAEQKWVYLTGVVSPFLSGVISPYLWLVGGPLWSIPRIFKGIVFWGSLGYLPKIVKQSTWTKQLLAKCSKRPIMPKHPNLDTPRKICQLNLRKGWFGNFDFPLQMGWFLGRYHSFFTLTPPMSSPFSRFFAQKSWMASYKRWSSPATMCSPNFCSSAW